MTEVALYDEPELVEAQPLTPAQAKKLDKQIRTKNDQIITSHEKTLKLFDELKDLVSQARDGEIHKALNVASWTAYLADAVNFTVTERDDRKAVAQFLSGEGASQRAIAKMLGVSQKTVDRDLEGVDVEEGATVTSLDGAERPKKGKTEEPEVIDAEWVEEAEPEQDSGPTPAADLVRSFDDEVANLHNAFAEMQEHLTEEKWSGARKRVAKANLNEIESVITGLQHIVDDLMGA